MATILLTTDKKFPHEKVAVPVASPTIGGLILMYQRDTRLSTIEVYMRVSAACAWMRRTVYSELLIPDARYLVAVRDDQNLKLNCKNCFTLNFCESFPTTVADIKETLKSAYALDTSRISLSRVIANSMQYPKPTSPLDDNDMLCSGYGIYRLVIAPKDDSEDDSEDDSD
jgi:hypothetical protein